MSKMYIMVGLPGSGKSTRAKEIVESTGNTVRINRDLLRTMLHFDKWSGVNESHTKDSARKLADWFLSQERNVIIDDTNLNAGTVESWKQLAKIHDAKVEIVTMDTPLETCLERDASRENPVGRHVIVGMAMKAGLYPMPEKGIVICDIDGTLADISHRLHFVRDLPPDTKKDWKAFFAALEKDTPRVDVIDKLMEFEYAGFEIFIVSGRPETYREQTEAWLEREVFKGYRAYKALFMRPANDKRPDTEVKQKIYDDYFKKYPIEKVIDDRPSVIRMWRQNGLDVVDVGNGEEF